MADIIVAGNTSGSVTISAPSVAGSTVLTLPVIATDTLAGIAATQTLTNKTLVAPALGTPASGVLTNCTGVAKAALPAGSVLQVVNGTYSTQTTSSSSAFADTGLTATITPTSASSKILVLVNQAGCGKQNSDTYLSLKLLRGATVISNFEGFAGYNATTTNNFFGSCSVCYLDSPATTSATTYKTQLASGSNNSQVYTQTPGTGTTSMSTITLMEIAA